jgi:SlyX protein
MAHCMDQNRLIDLETKFAHQELAIEKLQEIIYAQEATIQRLEQSLKILKERVEGLARGDGAVGAAGEKPPHY